MQSSFGHYSLANEASLFLHSLPLASSRASQATLAKSYLNINAAVHNHPFFVCHQCFWFFFFSSPDIFFSNPSKNPVSPLPDPPSRSLHFSSSHLQQVTIFFSNPRFSSFLFILKKARREKQERSRPIAPQNN